MDKHFLLVFSLFCCIKAVTPLRCFKCYLLLLRDQCRRGAGICDAEDGEICMFLKIYKNSNLQLSYMGCQRGCRDLTFDMNNRTYVNKCCNHDYCNFKL
ncbi:prostate and testis expressed protein 3 [Saccopteryx bilineata]|uniref:prostate and testis expressed protein 3 n=1 Tax=Saccopteryx bilineata TaxID=59482 RepID=UPI00338F381C